MAHAPTRTRSSKLLTGVTIALAAAIGVGLVTLWPDDVPPPRDADLLRRGELVEATVTSIEIVPCGTSAGAVGDGVGQPSPDPSVPPCRWITFVVEEGRDTGSNVDLELPHVSTSPDLGIGERVILERPRMKVPGMPYSFYDRIRSPSLIWLAILFAALVVLLGRMRGVAALVGLAASIAILLTFVIPAILQGTSPVLVASIGAGAIGIIVLYLAHGFSSRTTVAVIGTLSGVGVTLVLSLLWAPMARLSGLVSESAYIVQAVGAELDLGGLLLAGIVIGALGAIDDVAVTQGLGRLGAARDRSRARHAGPVPSRHARWSRPRRLHREHLGAGLRGSVPTASDPVPAIGAAPG